MAEEKKESGFNRMTVTVQVATGRKRVKEKGRKNVSSI